MPYQLNNHLLYRSLAVLAFVSFASPLFAQTLMGLGDLPGGSISSSASGVSADGSVVVGNSNSTSGTEAFRWTSGGGMVGLGDLAGGSFSSQADGVSADGSVVVGDSSGASGNEAFVWTEAAGMRGLSDILTQLSVDMTGWTLSQAKGISDKGRTIVGIGVPSGNTEAFVVDLNNLNLVWNGLGSSHWSNITNWTGSAGIFLPGETDTVSINPALSLAVTGPTAPINIQSLALGTTAVAARRDRLGGDAVEWF